MNHPLNALVQMVSLYLNHCHKINLALVIKTLEMVFLTLLSLPEEEVVTTVLELEILL